MKKSAFATSLLLLVSAFVHARRTNGTDIYNTNTGSVVIGATTPTAISSSAALFPSVKPKLSIVTGQGGVAYSELVTSSHPGVTTARK